MKLYENFRMPIRVTYFAFVLLAIGFLIQSKNVNLFYTFKSSIILFIGELFSRVGEIIIMNLPLIFMLTIVCKKTNSASPVVMAVIGYFTFLVTTMLFSTQSLNTQAYATGYGINSVFNLSSGTRLPLETGMIGSLLVAFATRVSFIYSRHRGNYSLANLFSKDIAGILCNVLLCFGLGVIIAYTYPFIYTYIQKAITFISKDLGDPLRIALYSIMDRFLSILGIGRIIRYPFWFTSTGGSLINTTTGQSILGDINIWTYVKDSVSTTTGAGRFITPYYVINIFIIPAYYLGTLFSISDRNDRNSLIITFVGAIGLSIIAGNPLPVELFMLFTAPFLLAFYLGLVGVISYVFVFMGTYLGFDTTVTNTAIAMPGSFVDFIVNIRNIYLSKTLWTIVIVGIIAFALMLLFTTLYYKIIAFDFANTGKGNATIKKIFESVGGIENVITAESGLLKLNVYLKNSELIDIEKIQKVGPKRIEETKDGVSLEFGTSSYAIAKRIKKVLKKKQA